MKIAGTAALLAVVLTQASSAQNRVDITRPASPGGALEVDLGTGSVRIVGWDRHEIAVTGAIGHDADLAFESEGGRAEIDLESVGRRRGGRRWHGSESRLEIRVPANTDVEVDARSATIHVSGVTGRLDLETQSGSITVDGSPRALAAETLSGSITVTATTSRAVLETTSGRVTVRDGGGALDVESVSGSIEISGGTFSQVSTESVSGPIDFDGNPAARGWFEFSSHSGNVVLTVPAEISADFDISTFSGDIRNEFGTRVRRTSRHAPGRELRFVTGGGGANIVVETFSGTVVLRQR